MFADPTPDLTCLFPEPDIVGDPLHDLHCLSSFGLNTFSLLVLLLGGSRDVDAGIFIVVHILVGVSASRFFKKRMVNLLSTGQMPRRQAFRAEENAEDATTNHSSSYQELISRPPPYCRLADETSLITT